MRSCGLVQGVLLAACIASGGCAPRWQPPATPPLLDEAPRSVDLRPYLPTPESEPRVFACRDVKDPTRNLPEYVQVFRPDGLAEVSFARPAGPVAEEGAPGRREPERPEGAIYTITLDPPLPRIPAAVDPQAPTRLQAKIRVCDAGGRERFHGTVDRRVTWEGFEPVELSECTLADCVRLRCVTRIRLFFGPWIELTEYIWLARDLGEVRRIERLSGWVWIWPFDEVREYDLVRPLPPFEGVTPPSAATPETWARVTVHLDRLLPSPRLGGIAVEYAARDAMSTAALVCLK